MPKEREFLLASPKTPSNFRRCTIGSAINTKRNTVIKILIRAALAWSILEIPFAKYRRKFHALTSLVTSKSGWKTPKKKTMFKIINPHRLALGLANDFCSIENPPISWLKTCRPMSMRCSFVYFIGTSMIPFFAGVITSTIDGTTIENQCLQKMGWCLLLAYHFTAEHQRSFTYSIVWPCILR